MMKEIHYDESIFDRPHISLEELNVQARLGGYPYFLVLSKFTKKLLLEVEDEDKLAAAYVFNTTNKHVNSEDDLKLAAYIPFNLSPLGQIEIHWQLFGSSESCNTYNVDSYYPYENGYKKLFNRIYSYPGDSDILSKMIHTRDMRLLSKNEDILIGRDVPDTGLIYYLLRVFSKSMIVDGKVLFAGIYSKAIDRKDSPLEPIPDSLVVGFEYNEKENVVKIHDFYYDTREECFKVMTSYKREYNVVRTASEMTHVLLNVMYSSKDYIEIDSKYFGNKIREEQRENLGGKDMVILNENKNIKSSYSFKKKRNRWINGEKVLAFISQTNPEMPKGIFHVMHYTTPDGKVRIFKASDNSIHKYDACYLNKFVNLKACAEDIIEVESKIKVPENFDRSILNSGFFAWDSSSCVTARVNGVIVIGTYKHVPKNIDKINLTFIKRNKRLDLLNEGDLVIGLDKDDLDTIKFINIKGEVVDSIPVNEKILTEVLKGTGIIIPAKVIEIMYNNALELKENSGVYKKGSKLKRYIENLD